MNRMILIGEGSLRRAIGEFVVHYHTERNHQSLENKIIRPEFAAFPSAGEVHCRERLGGMLRYRITTWRRIFGQYGVSGVFGITPFGPPKARLIELKPVGGSFGNEQELGHRRSRRGLLRYGCHFAFSFAVMPATCLP